MKVENAAADGEAEADAPGCAAGVDAIELIEHTLLVPRREAETLIGDGDDYGVKIHYTEEIPDILGTSGALDNARHLLEDDAFVIVNGKIIPDIDISEAVETHRQSGAIATMVLKPSNSAVCLGKLSFSMWIM